MARTALICSLALTACVSVIWAQAYLTPLDFGLKVGEHGMVDYQHRPASVLVGRFNQDNYPDILRFNGSTLELFLFTGKGYSMRPQMQNTFGKPINSLRLEGDVWSSQRDLVVTLTDGSEETFGYKSGILDLRENEVFGTSLDWQPRQIDEFDFQIVWQSETYPFGFSSCTAGDLDNDGIEELVSYWKEGLFADSAWMLIYKCTGDNEYELFMEERFGVEIGDHAAATQMLIADLDKNGLNELIWTYDKCYVWEFSEPGIYTSWSSNFIFPRHVDAIKITDVDQDSVLEIAAITTNADLQPPTYYLVEEFLQKSNPPDSTIFFSPITWFGQAWEDVDMDVGDFDNDGAVDIVSGNAEFIFGYEPVETQYFRYDEGSFNPPNFTRYWLSTGLSMRCCNPIIEDMDGDGGNELFAGGFGFGFGGAFVWEATGLQTGYIAWIDTTSVFGGPNQSSYGEIDDCPSVASSHINSDLPTGSSLVVWTCQDGAYRFAWQSPDQDSCFYNRPVVADADLDGKKSIYEADDIQHRLIDWEQTAVGIREPPIISPLEVFYLYANYPNPFNASTTILFDLPAPGPVRFRIFNVAGQAVYTREESFLPAGRHAWKWEPRDLTSGIYLYRLSAGDWQAAGKMVLMK